jgi:hypothetical protein
MHVKKWKFNDSTPSGPKRLVHMRLYEACSAKEANSCIVRLCVFVLRAWKIIVLLWNLWKNTKYEQNVFFSFQFNLSFLVEDTKNASSPVLVPTINVCACQNQGVCVQQATTAEIQSLLFSPHTVLSCECSNGFIGEFCETVRDFCQTQSGSPCHPQSRCINSPTNYTCGSCPSGYRGNGIDCSGRILADWSRLYSSLYRNLSFLQRTFMKFLNVWALHHIYLTGSLFIQIDCIKNSISIHTVHGLFKKNRFIPE